MDDVQLDVSLQWHIQYAANSSTYLQTLDHIFWSLSAGSSFFKISSSETLPHFWNDVLAQSSEISSQLVLCFYWICNNIRIIFILDLYPASNLQRVPREGSQSNVARQPFQRWRRRSRRRRSMVQRVMSVLFNATGCDPLAAQESKDLQKKMKESYGVTYSVT